MTLYNYGNSGFSLYDCTKTELSKKPLDYVSTYSRWCSHIWIRLMCHRLRKLVFLKSNPHVPEKFSETRHETFLFSINGVLRNKRISLLRIWRWRSFCFLLFVNVLLVQLDLQLLQVRQACIFSPAFKWNISILNGYHILANVFAVWRNGYCCPCWG